MAGMVRQNLIAVNTHTASETPLGFIVCRGGLGWRLQIPRSYDII